MRCTQLLQIGIVALYDDCLRLFTQSIAQIGSK